MSYAGGNRGGTTAILAAEALRASNANPTAAPETHHIKNSFSAGIDRVMGEAGLFAESLTADAFLQAQGDTAEAVHLMRAHRTSLPRFATSCPLDLENMRLDRRICSAQRSPEGPQLLGATLDYSPRILRRPGEPDPLPHLDEGVGLKNTGPDVTEYEDSTPPRFSSHLDALGILQRREPADDTIEPFDPSTDPVRLPAHRSAWLAAMAGAETGGLVHLWYRSITGPEGYTDESVTLGEVRHGEIDVEILHPYTGKPVCIGAIRLTECEAIDHPTEDKRATAEPLDAGRFSAGYGAVLGHNERKAIAMAALDSGLHRLAGTPEGSTLEQVVMMTTDPLASNGFLEHLKMPHYVTFESMIERATAALNQGSDAEEEERHSAGDEPVQSKDSTP